MGKMSASKLIHHLSNYILASGFQASLPSDDIALIFLIFRLSTYSYTGASLVDTITSLQSSDGGLIPTLEVLELLGLLTFWTVLCLNGLVILPGRSVTPG